MQKIVVTFDDCEEKDVLLRTSRNSKPYVMDLHPFTNLWMKIENTLESVVVKDSLTFEEVPVEILDRQKGSRTMKGTTVRRPARGSHPPRSGGPRSSSRSVDHHTLWEGS
ncbi:hypothetical protein MTR67_040293 [Solanum verrucosum]|uniref:Uncharacterized protein n=1 Tax=Solanum verrucosum TaxID=315347 RepID=A0AAF0ZR97_SOLVR|nr:hypothetical protein MTR67_040293 [Solanum verrucosum]